MVKKKQDKYNLGDIVFVNEFNFNKNKLGKNHLFVVVADDNKVVPPLYFGLIVSSHREKSRDNSNFKYNVSLNKGKINSLKYYSVVKCDQLYVFPRANIQFKIGSAEIDDFIRFIQTYDNYISETLNNK